MPTQAPSRALFALTAVVGLGLGLLPGCPDAANQCDECAGLQCAVWTAAALAAGLGPVLVTTG